MPLAEKYRPKEFDDIVGQTQPVMILKRMTEQHTLKSCIFYGPPGTGKTTLARIVAQKAGMSFSMLNAITAKLDDIRKAISEGLKNAPSTIIYLDEIQYFNKKQQQSLLPFLEDGTVILISATTDNPYFSCHKALLSRCQVMEFKPIPSNLIASKLFQTACEEQIDIQEQAARILAQSSGGDMRRAYGLLEMAQITAENTEQTTPAVITPEVAQATVPSTNMPTFDTDGDDHYALISALQKSIRGSDPNAAVFYLARLLEAGDILSPCRRLLVIAHEDIGLGNPDAIPFVQACVEAAKELGIPEANKPLTNAVIYLAISPKCSTCENTYNAAANDVHAGLGASVPYYLRHACSKGYLYPHDYPGHWVRQQYLPDDLVGRIYYQPGDNAFEQNMARYWIPIMSRK